MPHKKCGFILKKMSIKKLKEQWKEEVVDILLAFGVVLIVYFTFNYFKPSIEEMLLPIIFILVLILLKLPNKK